MRSAPGIVARHCAIWYSAMQGESLRELSPCIAALRTVGRAKLENRKHSGRVGG
jgi:hypothetical protein